jgi:hypothetical protein
MGLFSFINSSISDIAKAQDFLDSWYETMSTQIDDSEQKINLQGLIGSPPVFSDYADAKTDRDNYGSEYVRRFIEDGNFVAIEAGRPNIQIDSNDASKANGDSGDSANIVKRLLNTLQDSDGQLFTFETDMGAYWDDVQKIAGMTATLLGIEDIVEQMGITSAGIDSDDNDGIHAFNWSYFRSQYLRDYASDGKGNWNFVTFYNDGIIETGESISHTVGPTSIERNINNNVVTNNPAANAAGEFALLTGQDIYDSLEDLGRHTEDSAIQDSSLWETMTNLFTGGMAGLNIKMDLPDIWQDTQYSKDYNLKFKFTTPHGDPVSVWLNVIVPLAHILPFVSAREVGISNTYLGGYILRIFSEGMVNLNLGMATNVTIERNQKATNINGMPTELTVTVTVKDLQPMFALPANMSYGNIIKSTGLMSYLGTLCGYNSAYFDAIDRVGLSASATMSDLESVLSFAGIKTNFTTKSSIVLERATQNMLNRAFPI